MKNPIYKYALIILSTFSWMLSSFAQVPPSVMSFQASIVDEEGNQLYSQEVGLKFIIHSDSENGPVVYEESQLAQVSEFGVVNVLIGNGLVILGNLDSIDWGGSPKYLEILVDSNGDSMYTSIDTEAFSSLPHALYAKSTLSTDQVFEDFLHIGKEFQGGVIFHLEKDNEGITHGLIVSVADQGITEWGFLGDDVSGADSMTNGWQNTLDIMNAGGSESDAAGLCANYSYAGYDDWYLPALDELLLLHKNMYFVNKSLVNMEDGSPLDFWQMQFWTSTEFNIVASERFDMIERKTSTGPKDIDIRVRAIRAFQTEQ